MSPKQTFQTKVPRYIALLMRDFSFDIADAAAVMGNAGHESRGLTAMQEERPRGGRGGWGWFQWTGSRRRKFEEYCARNGLDPTSDEANYGFLVVELKGSHKSAVGETKRARGLAEKVKAFELSFEKAADDAKHYPKRIEWAEWAVKAWNASGQSAPQEPSPGTVPSTAVITVTRMLRDDPGGATTDIVAVAGARVLILDDSSPLWWKIQLLDVAEKAEGWVSASAVDKSRDALGPLDRLIFALECCRQGDTHGVNAHYIMSVAQLRTNITDGPNGNGVDYGPFALSPFEWKHLGQSAEFDFDWEADDIKAWRIQCLVFAAATSLMQKALATLLGGQPSSIELYLAQIIGSEATASALHNKTQAMEAVIANITATEAVREGIDRERIPIRYAAFTGGTVQDALKSIEAMLQEAMNVTLQFILDAGGEIGLPDQGHIGDAETGPAILPPLGEDSRLAQRSQPIDLFDVAGDSELASEVQACLIQYGLLDPPVDGEFGGVSNWALSEFCSQKNIDLGQGLTKSLARKLLQAAQHPIPIAFGSNLASRIARAMSNAGYWINRHPKCLNIVYVEGMNGDGTANDNKPNRFNDCRCLLSIDANGKPRLAGIWDGTTEPSRYFTEVDIQDPGGAARIAFGQYKAWTVGTYNNHEVLRQATAITVFRDLNKDYRREGDKSDTGVFGIHHHWGYNYPKNDLGRSSAGCLVGRTKKGHLEFMKLVKSDPRHKAANAYRIMATVLPVSDLPPG
jgi:tail lysozyme